MSRESFGTPRLDPIGEDCRSLIDASFSQSDFPAHSHQPIKSQELEVKTFHGWSQLAPTGQKFRGGHWSIKVVYGVLTVFKIAFMGHAMFF